VSGRASNRSASNNDLVKQSTRLKLGERAFFVARPRDWNQLPTDLKAITDTRVFKPLKTFIFASIPLALTHIVLGHRSAVGGNIGSVLLYCIVLYCFVLYCTVLYCTVLYCIVLYWISWQWRSRMCNSWETVVGTEKVVVYGSNVDVYCCVQTLLQAGLPGNQIVIVKPPKPSQVTCLLLLLTCLETDFTGTSSSISDLFFHPSLLRLLIHHTTHP